MSTTAEASQGRMPRQIPYIIGNEACERFSFYGMRNILVPFLISSVLLAYLPDQATREGAAKDLFHRAATADGADKSGLTALTYPVMANFAAGGAASGFGALGGAPASPPPAPAC